MAEQQQQQQQQQGLLLDRDQLCCSICLDLLNQPVTLHCGHSYCRDCIESCWGKDEEKGVYSCPQCRQTFSPRPALVKNTMLAQIVENLKTTGNQQASPSADVSYAGPTDVACNFCIGTRPHKALMTCSVCLASYCSTHLQPHYTVPVLKKHKLVSVTARLQEKMCFSHDKLMEVYCRTDQQCICYLCIMHEHKGHDTVSAEAERAEIQKQLGVSRQKAQQRLQEREKEIKKLRQAVEDLKSSAQTAVEDSERIFTELMASIERRRSEVKELIRAQEKTAVSQIEELLLQLEEEMEEWRRSDSELEQLSHTDDHIHFIQKFKSLSLPAGSPDSPSIVVRPLRYFRDVTDDVSVFRDKLDHIMTHTWPRISSPDVLLPPEPKTREDCLLYCRPLTLDVNSAHQRLSLSDDNRKVTWTPRVLNYPPHSDRFTNYSQVLCKEGLSGRCYWEVTLSGRVDIAVSYKDIKRSSRDSAFGCNDKSWMLICSGGRYWFRHNGVVREVSGPSSSRVGVFLDHKAGVLSFYSVSDTTTLLHKVNTTFTQPLYPGLWLLGNGAVAEVMKVW
ncbi:tripartite motif-containing protein 16-like isoform X2 [Lampris incognitus]|uniref:tripartite motif-containing protein 16-like isoform X2 n=1 Tax=Lampris incognitus TaxID=2546036 RepID=UPI0024B4C17B|nr:tripartite motif-containing protein 16-like isoform X2 [Lampris incognitus]